MEHGAFFKKKKKILFASIKKMLYPFFNIYNWNATLQTYITRRNRKTLRQNLCAPTHSEQDPLQPTNEGPVQAALCRYTVRHFLSCPTITYYTNILFIMYNPKEGERWGEALWENVMTECEIYLSCIGRFRFRTAEVDSSREKFLSLRLFNSNWHTTNAHL